jgi:hypothetical protein
LAQIRERFGITARGLIAQHHIRQPAIKRVRAQRDHEGGHFQSGDEIAVEQAAECPQDQRGQCGNPNIQTVVE